ncbi:hypothetical protein MMC17_009075 [Xylographa soralifera]|nr:hypothetical protein [Xylographa soralifera]
MSIRSLPLRHMAKAVNRRQVGEEGDPEALLPDQMRLYSYYKPSLVAGSYTIEAEQNVVANVKKDNGSVVTQSLRVTNVRATPDAKKIALQEFQVVVPRFTLDPALINSYYPPDGHQDEGRILPHLVIDDPHYPWEIDAGVTTNMSGPIDGQPALDPITGEPMKDPDTGKDEVKYRSIVPWVALMVFDSDDLRLSAGDITNLCIPGAPDASQQNANGIFKMQVSDYFTKLPHSSRVNFEAGVTEVLDEAKEDDSLMDAIFPSKALFRSLFGDLESHKYLAHVRHINTVGFPDAGVEEEGLYSIVISSRTGRLDVKQPTTQICHLLSMENFDSTLAGAWLNDDTGKGSDRVGLISLFSWTYTVLPPDPVNFVDTMRNLVTSQQMFRADQQALDTLDKAITGSSADSVKTQASKLLATRLRLGYTLARWRTETGEETTAFNRGPLAPQPVRHPPVDDLPDCSNTSKEYQILDPGTGLMDLSYSSAWQLGKLLAISDTVFSAALMRFRSIVYSKGSNQTRSEINGVVPASSLIAKAQTAMASIQSKSIGNTGDPSRFMPLPHRTVAPSVKDSKVFPIFRANIMKEVIAQSNAGDTTFNEFNENLPNNNDWVIIHNWLSDKLFLGDIPPQFLVPEPSFIPQEGLRYFYIDDFWLDCLIDGALSVANHLDHEDDHVRRDIKNVFNNYLRTVVNDTIKPQIPCYGFILRSKLVETLPDLRITVTWKTDDPDDHKREDVCRWTKYDKQTIVCLLDRQPQELEAITLAQPPHQQRFSLGYGIVASEELLEVHLRTLYTKGAPGKEGDPPDKWIWPPLEGPDTATDTTKTWLNWDTRCINTTIMARDVNAALQFNKKDQAYTDTMPNSCELGLELNDPSYFFKVIPPQDSDPDVPPRDRQIYVNDPTETKKDTKTTSLLRMIPEVASPPMLAPQFDAPHARLVSSAIRFKAPHQATRIQALPRSLPPPPRTLVPRVGAAEYQSRFDIKVFPDYHLPPTDPHDDGYDAFGYCPTNNVYYYDLIFSVRKSAAYSDSSYILREIVIDIPTTGLDPSGKDPDKEALLDQNYDGPGVRMLSNQRFIPFLYYTDTSLSIRLVPRRAADNANVPINNHETDELGFRLAEANIAPVKPGQMISIQGNDPKHPEFKNKNQKRGLAKVTMTEKYFDSQRGMQPVETDYFVVKWATTDANADGSTR